MHARKQSRRYKEFVEWREALFQELPPLTAQDRERFAAYEQSCDPLSTTAERYANEFRDIVVPKLSHSAA